MLTVLTENADMTKTGREYTQVAGFFCRFISHYLRISIYHWHNLLNQGTNSDEKGMLDTLDCHGSNGAFEHAGLAHSPDASFLAGHSHKGANSQLVVIQ